jgi:tRNA dimethylallyltransferase
VSTTAQLRYLALLGPTASGKTAAALAIAERLPVEIISLDSALVYRSMDIGTAKPSAAELAAVPHHLIDIRDPLQAYSAAEFANDARALISDITARGKLPLLVGGTMLYLKALREGLDAMPKADLQLRAALERQGRERGWSALHAELARVDPLSAARLNPADAQRISRALEVFRLTGKPLSSFHSSKSEAARADPHSLLISLEPSERSWLHERIAQRFDAMLARGFVEEVQALRERGDLNPDLPSMRCVGYRQAWQALDSLWPMSELRNKGIFATRQLAKRQLTWLRSMPERQVVGCDSAQAVEHVLALTQRFAGQQT